MNRRLVTSLREVRLARGLSQERLAREAGISRQSYGALESGQSIPSTDVALRLAAALESPLEGLFRLPGSLPPAQELELVGGALGRRLPFPVRVAQVAGTLRAYPLHGGAGRVLETPDGVVVAQVGERVRVEPLHPAAPLPHLVAAGCDPAFPLVAGILRERSGLETLALHAGSRRALEMLAAGEIHMAGIHLRDQETGGYNGPFVQRMVPFPCLRVGFSTWALDLLLPPGNPAGVEALEEVVGRGLTFAHREEGSGTRAFVDARLGWGDSGGRTAATTGQKVSLGHLAVAEVVAGGWADAGVAIRAAGRAWGLDTLPLVEERYDLVIPRHFLDLPAVGALLDHLRSPLLRRRVELLGGYDGEIMGEPA